MPTPTISMPAPAGADAISGSRSAPAAWPPVRLRRAQARDAQAIWSLCREAAGLPAGASLPLPLPLRETLFDTPCRGWAWLAEIDGQAVGVVVASAGLALPSGAYRLSIDGLYVRKAWRGRGLGTRLTAHVREMADEMGCRELRLSDGTLCAISPLAEAARA